MLTTFFNMESDLYYELFTSFIGKGDKESFAYALAATRSPYSVVHTPVGSVGQIGQVGRHNGLVPGAPLCGLHGAGLAARPAALHMGLQAGLPLCSWQSAHSVCCMPRCMSLGKPALRCWAWRHAGSHPEPHRCQHIPARQHGSPHELAVSFAPCHVPGPVSSVPAFQGRQSTLGYAPGALPASHAR